MAKHENWAGIHPDDYDDFLEMLRAWKSGEIPRGDFPSARRDAGMRPPIRFVLLENMPRGGSADAAVTKLDNSGNEIQRITLAGEIAGGGLKLVFDGQTTAQFDWDADADEVRQAIEGLSNIESGDVAVEAFRGGWRVIFTGQYAGEDVPLMKSQELLQGFPNQIRISSDYAWVDAGQTETIHEVIPVGTPTPLIAGAVGVASWFPRIPGYGLHALECRDLDAY